MPQKTITFNRTEMEALLAGRKTQFRRLIKCKGEEFPFSCFPEIGSDNILTGKFWLSRPDIDRVTDNKSPCPFGEIGDKILIKQSKRGRIAVAENLSVIIEIVNIRVQKLGSFSNEDAIAEGVFFTDYGKRCFHSKEFKCEELHHPQRPGWAIHPTKSENECLASPISAFINYWHKNYGYHREDTAWDKNKWVWLVDFKVV